MGTWVVRDKLVVGDIRVWRDRPAPVCTLVCIQACTRACILVEDKLGTPACTLAPDKLA